MTSPGVVWPMKSKIIQSVGFLKTTAIGGLLFLLPLAVIGALLGYVYNAVLVVYTPLREYLPVSSTLGVLLLFLIAVAIVLFLCFVCGLAARRAIARQFTQTIEKQLVTVYPKYAIYKDILTGNISDGTIGPSLQPVTVRLDDMIRIGYEAGRTSRRPRDCVSAGFSRSVDWLSGDCRFASSRTVRC